MDSSYFTNPLIFLIQSLLGMYGVLILLRFLLQLVRAEFYNPISQFIVKVTALPLHPLRRLIPGIGGLDLASLVLAWLLKSIELLLVVLLLGGGINLLGAMLWAIPEIIEMVLNIFLVAILIQVVISWFGPQGGYNPAASLAFSLAEPFLEPARSLIPPISGLDFSPMLATVVIVLLKMLLLPPLKLLTGSPFKRYLQPVELITNEDSTIVNNRACRNFWRISTTSKLISVLRIYPHPDNCCA